MATSQEPPAVSIVPVTVILSCHSSTDPVYCCFGTFPSFSGRQLCRRRRPPLLIVHHDCSIVPIGWHIIVHPLFLAPLTLVPTTA